jgi:HD-GYP domain-containing protein (c-di-GMP phosphodiesterase class II)
VEDALDELERCAGSQFDPELVGIFRAAWGEGELDALVWEEAAAS